MVSRKDHSGKLCKVRHRGQLTVPLEVRKVLSWPEEEIAVKVTPLPEEDGFKVERVAAPHQGPPRRKLTEKEWDEVWQSMRRTSRLGEPVDLVEFLAKDRESH